MSPQTVKMTVNICESFLVYLHVISVQTSTLTKEEQIEAKNTSSCVLLPVYVKLFLLTLFRPGDSNTTSPYHVLFYIIFCPVQNFVPYQFLAPWVAENKCMGTV